MNYELDSQLTLHQGIITNLEARQDLRELTTEELTYLNLAKLIVGWLTMSEEESDYAK